MAVKISPVPVVLGGMAINFRIEAKPSASTARVKFIPYVHVAWSDALSNLSNFTAHCTSNFTTVRLILFILSIDLKCSPIQASGARGRMAASWYAHWRTPLLNYVTSQAVNVACAGIPSMVLVTGYAVLVENATIAISWKKLYLQIPRAILANRKWHQRKWSIGAYCQTENWQLYSNKFKHAGPDTNRDCSTHITLLYKKL